MDSKNDEILPIERKNLCNFLFLHFLSFVSTHVMYVEILWIGVFYGKIRRKMVHIDDFYVSMMKIFELKKMKNKTHFFLYHIIDHSNDP